MSRRKRAQKRVIKPDTVYNSVLVQRLINKIMLDGKVGAARLIVYTALKAVEQRHGNCLDVLEKAKENGRPHVEIRSSRLGGSNVSIPVNINIARSEALFLMWVADKVKSRNGKKAHLVLTNLLLDTYNNQGVIIKKKEDTHKMAEANKAFAPQFRNEI